MLLGLNPLSLSALVTTDIDDIDIAAAAIMGVTALSTVGGAGRWNALMPYVTLGSAVLWGCCVLLDRRKKSN